MAESSLAIGYPDLQTAVARVLGWPSIPASLTAAQTALVDECIMSGLRRFYYPPLGPGGAVHVWSFLRLVTTLTTSSGVAAYTLPDGFGSLDGRFTFAEDVRSTPIENIADGQMRELQQRNPGSAYPLYASIRPVATDGTAGQRYQVVFWPKPDAAYVLTYRYHVLPGKLTSTAAYPYGGAQHAEVLVECCLWAAEERVNDTSDIHARAAQAGLVAAVERDKRMLAPQTVGPVMDPGVFEQVTPTRKTDAITWT